MCEQGVYVIDVGVHLYMCMYMHVCIYVCMYICMYVFIYVTQKSLNGTLAVDSPFQILTVDFSSNL